MPRQVGTIVENNFVAGLITDSTAVNFPTNACTATDNCIFDDTGRITRRKGFDLETNYEVDEVVRDDSVIISHTWSEVNGDGDVKFLVVQAGTILHFYDLSFPIISAGHLTSTIDLLDFDAAGANSVGATPCSFANGVGRLFVAHPECTPFYVTYNASANTVGATAINIKIRDLVGVDDSLAVDARPTATVGTLSNAHKYNLFNQGWYFNSNAALTAWDTARTDMPSNADFWWFYKDASDDFSAALVAKRTLGNSAAPKGHYILDAFNLDRSTVSGISGISTVSTAPSRPRAVAFFAGRVWYAGVDYPGFSNNVYFTRTLEDITQAGRCYQDNDPTSENLSDLLPSDGGVVNVEGMGSVITMRTLGNALLIFTTAGVWSVTGSQGVGFIATDYAVAKVSSIPAEDVYSFIDIDGRPCWWNSEGIYIIDTQDGVTFQIQSLTDRKIRKYIIDNIPATCRKQAVGAYNPNERTAQWLFRVDPPSNIREISQYQKVLIYNFLTQAFYVWTLPPDHAINVNGIFMTKGVSGAATPLSVVDDMDDPVVDEDGDPVVAYDLGGTFTTPIFLYLATYTDGSAADQLTIAKAVSTLYVDWASYLDDSPYYYTSTFTIGHRMQTEGQRFFQTNYVFVFLEQEENASCYMHGTFEFTNSGNSGKWSTPQQVYNSSLLNRNVNYRRLKVRGKGREMRLKFDSEAGKPFTIVGWSIWSTASAGL